MRPMKTRTATFMRIACSLSIVSLALMSWSVLDPRPMPVVLALSLGQVVGTLALASFAVVVLRDIGWVKRPPASVRAKPSEAALLEAERLSKKTEHESGPSPR